MVCVLESFWTWRSKSQFHFSTVHGRFQDCFSRFRGIPNCGHCADASARKASATKCGWDWIMDFHPDVSIMSVAWLKNKIKRCLLKSTFQNALLHCQFFFFLIDRFQNVLEHSVCLSMYSNHLNSLKYHLYLTGIFFCKWNYAIFLEILLLEVCDTCLHSSTPTVTISRPALSRALFPGSYVQVFFRVLSFALDSSPLTFFTYLISSTIHNFNYHIQWW